MVITVVSTRTSKPTVRAQRSFYTVSQSTDPLFCCAPCSSRGPSFFEPLIKACDMLELSGKPHGVRVLCVSSIFRDLRNPSSVVACVVATRLVFSAVTRERSSLHRSTGLISPTMRAEPFEREARLPREAKRFIEPNQSNMWQYQGNVPDP